MCCIRSRLANLSKSRKRMDRRALVVLGTNVKPFDNTEISMGDKVWLERLTICLERSRIFLPVLPGLCRDRGLLRERLGLEKAQGREGAATRA